MVLCARKKPEDRHAIFHIKRDTTVQDSRHLYENRAIAVDLVVTGVAMPTFKRALITTSFDPRKTESRYPDDPHVHIELPALYSLPLNAVPDDLTGRKDVCR